MPLLEEVLKYILAIGILSGVWKASSILSDIRNMLKSGEKWMNDHKPIIEETHEAVKAHQRGGFELAHRVSKLDDQPMPPEFERPYLS